MSINNQNALKLEEVIDDKSLKNAFMKNGKDPLLEMEYVSPVNQGRFSSIGKLESGVSLIQAAQVGIEKSLKWLIEIRQFLEESNNETSNSKIPKSVASRYIADRLDSIDHLVNTSTFQNKTVLDGSYGVKARTSGGRLKFVRGSARVMTSPENGYAIKVYQPPKPSILIGNSGLTENELKQEKLIALKDGTQEVRYRIRSDETPETLVNNLRNCLMLNHFDVDVHKTDDNRLFFKHKQFGSKTTFGGVSYNSRLISKTPGQYVSAIPGIDIAGLIGEESARGDGGFLVGEKGNATTDGLVVYYDGPVEFPGQVVGYIKTWQNGLAIPLDSSGLKMEMLSLPSIDPDVLSVGVSNSSGFENLKSIRTVTETEYLDALRMVVWSIIYLNFLAKELKQKEEEYVERTINMLSGSTAGFSTIDDALSLSKSKAADMISQLNEMLTK